MSNSTGLTGLLPFPHGNATLIENNDLCTKATCDLTLAQVDYLPSLPGNAIFATLFALCLLGQVLLGMKYRTWGFMTAMAIGTLTEIIGYVGRIMMHSDPFNKNNFLVYLVPLTLAPAFLSAAIYLCLARIVVVYGEEKSRFRPRTYTILFCSCDFFALLLQAIGGAIASGADTPSDTQVGINILLAGLSFQVFSLLLFSAACIEFGMRIYCSSRAPGHPYSWGQNSSTAPSNSTSSITSGGPLQTSLPKTSLFRAFLIGLAVATLSIFIRSIYRVAELSKGFDGALANNQTTFIILEATLISIACLCLTILHPGLCFQGEWRAANFKMGKKRQNSTRLSILGSKKISASSSENDVEAVTQPPTYVQSTVTLDRSPSLDNDSASVRVGTPQTGRRATTMMGTMVRPGQVHVEMLPVYGVRYESTSDNLPAPLT